MKKFLLPVLLLTLVFGCNKDKFQTKPQLSLKSMNGNVIPAGGTLNLVLEFTDKEGDVQDTLFMTRTRINRRGFDIKNNYQFVLPQFPDNKKGEISVDLPQSSYLSLALTPIAIPGSGNRNEPDSLILKFVLRDKAGNKSDTLVVPDIYVIR
ncbi:MAG: hypothetical protein C4330_01480 [Chitinophagaceae bacterium]